LPALGAARETARSTQCSATLRQVGIAIYAYEVDFAVLPAGIHNSASYFDWTFSVPDDYMGGGGTGPAFATRREKVLQCPAAEKDVETPGDDANHYSAHPRLMPDLNMPDPANPGENLAVVRTEAVISASDKFLVIDGALNPLQNFSAQPLAKSVDNFRIFWQGLVAAPGDNLDELIDVGTNVDDASNFEQPRFRHGGNTTANAVHVDGHVQAHRFDEMTARSTRILAR
ncbi:MAG: DUF1559 domain-containing protein, partial [Planctomycetota bacterium]